MRKHILKVLDKLKLPLDEANKIETLLKWCSTYQFNVEIVSQTDDVCFIEFSTKFLHDDVITFKEGEIYHVITNRSKFFETFKCKKIFTGLSLDEEVA